MSFLTWQESRESLAALADYVRAGGENTAVLHFTRDGVEAWSGERLGECACRLAGGLRQDGLQPGEKVLLFAPASAPFFAAMLAIMRAGGVAAPIDIQFSDENLEHVFESSEATRIFTTTRLARRLEQLDRKTRSRVYLLDVDASQEKSWEALLVDEPGDPADRAANDEAVLFYTSGTTGKPKGVPLSQANIRSQIKAIEASGLIREGERILLPLPLHHVYPVVIGVLIPLALQVAIILPHALSGSAITGALRDSRATIVLGVPRLYRAIFQGVRGKVAASGRLALLVFTALLAFSRLLDRAGVHVGRRLFGSLHRKMGPDVRLLASGGSLLDPALARNLEALGWPVAVGYGLTETSPLLTLRWPYEGRHSSVGRAIEGVELEIDPGALSAGAPDEPAEAAESPADGRGELLVRGGNVFAGYHQLPEETAKSFTDGGWFRTGDVARLDEEGFLYLHGRLSTMIVREGGENVDPEKVEEIYEDSPEIEEIGVLEDDGELAALVMPSKEVMRGHKEEGWHERIEQAMQKYGSQLASYQRVSRVAVTRTPLQRTRLGKVKRRALEEAYAKAKADKERAGEDKAPAGPMAEEEMPGDVRALMEDERVWQLWDLLAKRYHDKPLSPDSHFEFDLGLDSMDRVELSLAIEEQLKITMDESKTSGMDRVRDVMEYIAEHEGDDEAFQSRRPIKEPELSLTEAERRWAVPRGPLRSFAATLLYGALHGGLRLLCRVETQGLEHVPEEGSFIIMPNHLSLLDSPALAVALGYRRARRCFWAGSTAVLFGNVWLRSFSRLAQVVPIEGKQGAMRSLAISALILKRERPLVWFPEGGVSRSGKLEPFRQGIGLLLEVYDRPVVPVCIRGTEKALPRGRFFPRPAKVVIRFGAPVAPEDQKAYGKGAGEERETHHRITKNLEQAFKRHCAPDH